MTRERMKTFVVTAPLRDAMLREIETREASATTSSDPSPMPSETLEKRYRSTSYAEGFGTTTNLTNNHDTDTEPTVISMLKGSVMHTAVVSTTFPLGSTNAKLISRHSTSLPAFDLPHDLPIPAGYTQAGDPYLAANSYTTGVWGGRMYCVGVLFTDRTGSAASAIAVWHSDDSGISWSAPAIVSYANGGGHLLDKPNISVSGYPGVSGQPNTSTRGHVYVTWVDVDINNHTGNSLNVARSTDGGATFTSPTIVSFQFVQFPQVLVNPSDGTVSVIWTNLNFHEILMSQSNAALTSFGAYDIVSALYVMDETTLNGGIVANSIPASRYDWVQNRIVVVYTGTSSSGSGSGATDVYYTFKGGCSNCNSYGWQQPIQVASDTRNDQFMPAIDFKINGDVVVSYYDRRDDQTTPNLVYREYVTHMTSNGATRLYESQATGAPASTPGGRSIGDYQDLWSDNYFDGEAATIPWIGFPQTFVTDLYLTRFFYQ